MKYIKCFESFVNEKKGPTLSPAAKLGKALSSSMEKISDLKSEIIENPEKRAFLAAKVKVEKEKLDVIQANAALNDAKEREERRKEMEKRKKEQEKESKERAKKLMNK